MHVTRNIRRLLRLRRSQWWQHGNPSLCILAACMLGLLAACAETTTAPLASATLTPTDASVATPTALPLGCPQSNQPTIQSGARLRLSPTGGAVGTIVTVEISSLQPNCHLLLGIAVAPALTETHGTPISAPMLADEAIQWVAVSPTGTVHTTFCVCQTMPSYPVGYPPYTSVTPVAGQPNVGAYAPRAGDYFFITVAGPGIPDPPPLYAAFTVTD